MVLQFFGTQRVESAVQVLQCSDCSVAGVLSRQHGIAVAPSQVDAPVSVLEIPSRLEVQKHHPTLVST